MQSIMEKFPKLPDKQKLVAGAAVVCAVSADLLPHAVNDNAIAAANIVATTDLLFIK